MSECRHIHLTKLEGPVHGPDDYRCNNCGAHFIAKPLEISVVMGQPQADNPPKEGA